MQEQKKQVDLVEDQIMSNMLYCCTILYNIEPSS